MISFEQWLQLIGLILFGATLPLLYRWLDLYYSVKTQSIKYFSERRVEMAQSLIQEISFIRNNLLFYSHLNKFYDKIYSPDSIISGQSLENIRDIINLIYLNDENETEFTEVLLNCVGKTKEELMTESEKFFNPENLKKRGYKTPQEAMDAYVLHLIEQDDAQVGFLESTFTFTNIIQKYARDAYRRLKNSTDKIGGWSIYFVDDLTIRTDVNKLVEQLTNLPELHFNNGKIIEYHKANEAELKAWVDERDDDLNRIETNIYNIILNKSWLSKRYSKWRAKKKSMSSN